MALRGIRRSQIPDKRKPITLKILKALVQKSKLVLQRGESQCFNTLCCVLFFGFFRISELLGDQRRGIKPMRRSQVVREGSSCRLRLMRSKCSAQPATVKISEQPDKHYCPVTLLNKYLKDRSDSHNVLFVNSRAEPLRSHHFRSQLSLVLQAIGKSPDCFTPHSFRIGAASYAAAMGLADAEIRQLGRWRSSAFLRYVRHYRSMALSTAARFS